LGVGLVPYSPLSKGILSDTVINLGDPAKNDHRRTLPWWRLENLVTNQRCSTQFSRN
jgi:hypothetical protein